MKSTPQVIEHCHQCLKWMVPTIDKLPRQRRFTLGEELESAL
ncbi:four helix bundle protein [Alteromonas hispanica]|nr:four helix bundle protein [Alteromonas hispanica]